MDVGQIFHDLGGPAAVAKAIGKSTEHAAAMRRRRSIPVRYWPAILEAAKAAGVSLTEVDLTRAHAPSAA